MTAPTRYCPACFTPNDWGDDRRAACGVGLASTDSFDERLVWALDHPDTATAMVAAALLARRDARSSIDPLVEATDSADPYRAAATGRALTAFDDDRARAAVENLRHHRSALVRRAVDRP
jgi:hypothetical protein